MYLICTSFAAPKVETKCALYGLVFHYVKAMEFSAPNMGHFNYVAALLNINQSLFFICLFSCLVSHFEMASR